MEHNCFMLLFSVLCMVQNLLGESPEHALILGSIIRCQGCPPRGRIREKSIYVYVIKSMNGRIDSLKIVRLIRNDKLNRISVHLNRTRESGFNRI